jgi:hypothetical protein
VRSAVLYLGIKATTEIQGPDGKRESPAQQTKPHRCTKAQVAKAQAIMCCLVPGIKSRNTHHALFIRM